MNPFPRGHQPTICNLGRAGDALSVAPIAKELSLHFGERIDWLISREYAGVLRCMSYVSGVPFDGHFGNVGEAIKKFRNRHPSIVLAQAWSRDGSFPPPQCESFVHEAWNRAGKLPHFGLPLDIDQRSPEREAAMAGTLGMNGQPVLLVSLSGHSSPYPYRASLLSALNDLKKHYHIVDISDLQCAHISDVLGLMDRAAVAVLSDSAHLHLSYASPGLKVVGLQSDNPNRWFGTPRRHNWIAAHRYGESLVRLPDVLAQLKAAAFPRQPSRRIITGIQAGGYNPSIIRWGGKLLCIYRHHPARSWHTRLRVAELDDSYRAAKDLPVEFPNGTQGASQEDARFFVHAGRLFISYNIAHDAPPGALAKAAVGYGPLVRSGSHWFVESNHHIKYGKNDFSACEKNFVFWSHEGKLYCIYQGSPDQIVLQIAGDKVLNEFRTPAMPWAHGSIRGDTAPLAYNGQLLRFFHSLVRYPSGQHRYHIGAVTMEAEPPFRMTGITQGPLFSGQKGQPQRFHHKDNVVFSSGAIPQDDGWIISMGVNDEFSCIERVEPHNLMLA